MNALIYPYLPECLSVVELYQIHNPQIIIKYLICHYNYGMTNVNSSILKDAIISDQYNYAIEDVEILIILSGLFGDDFYLDIQNKIERALELGKKVICCEKQIKTEHLKDYIDSGQLIVNKIYGSVSKYEDKYLNRLESVVVAVGAMFSGLSTSTCVYKLLQQYEKEGYSVLLVSNNANVILANGILFPIEIFNLNIKEEEKIYELNHFFMSLDRKYRPDIVLLEYPDGLFKLSDLCCDTFGIYSYMLSQAITVDYFVYVEPFIDDVKELCNITKQSHEDVEKKYGLGIDSVVVDFVSINVGLSMEVNNLEYKKNSVDMLSTNDFDGLDLAMDNCYFMWENDSFKSIVEHSIELLSNQFEEF